jgi:butyryl-CoA dehydrogenase
MPTYQAPLRDMRFALYELHQGEALCRLPGLADATRDVMDAVLDEAGKLCAEVLAPLNRSGDEEGCHLDNGVVRTPKGFREAYRLFREGGWTGIACDVEDGGQGLPISLHTMVDEMVCSSNLAFSLYSDLSHGVYAALKRHGSPALKERYLAKLADGTWSGTMCLTEPQSGTDLGLVRTRAVPQADGSYRLSGSKCFISAGDHDLTENIIHLVLARLPDAPRGIKGISLFLVPKVLVGEDGRLGARNGVSCGRLERKMGIKASATCLLNFDEAHGWLVGEPHQGMRAMFTMMNSARLMVGLHGLSQAEASYQGAVAYARQRLQGRSLSGAKHPDKPADPIIVHTDVRRMLLTMRANVEGCRALGAWVAAAVDRAARTTDPSEQQDAEDLIALLTPVIKALFTDLGTETTNLGVQVFGGYGFIRDYGMEQFVRDVRITQIYEGTNGVQALDLVGRKLPAYGGRLLRSFFHPVAALIEARQSDDRLAAFVQPLAKALQHLQQATGHIAQRGRANPDEAGAAATEYLRLFGLVALAYMWVHAVEVALPKVGTPEDDDGFYRAKLGTARFFLERILPHTSALFAAIMAGGDSIMSFDEAAF